MSKEVKKRARRMSQNVPEFEWTEQRVEAAALVAQDALTDEEIASNLGIDRRTLTRWKGEAEFRQRVGEIVKETHERIVARGIAEKQNRIDALNRRWKLMDDVIRQRAENLTDVAGGGNTGLLVRQVKGAGSGEAFRLIEEYAVDTGLLKELREHEKQAAQELGQWTEKSDLTSNGKALIPPRIELIRSREQVRDDAGE